MMDEWKAKPDRSAEVPLQCLRFGEQLERLRQEPTWRTSGRNAITLVKEPAPRVVLMLLGKGIAISEHQAAGPLTFQILSGSVTFRAGDRAEQLGSGELVALEAAVAHEVEALDESACLLTLGGGQP
jgi:quercetin dioxygenase-like cupin family protein